ncbi:nucleotidyl transferase AbiEii/AbiGii toxin family protein [Pannonibacter sp. Pt2-lr]
MLFGGGTAIVLQLDEYRESVDIDFLCASQEGYRLIRQAVFGAGLAGLIRPEAEITPCGT